VDGADDFGILQLIRRVAAHGVQDAGRAQLRFGADDVAQQVGLDLGRVTAVLERGMRPPRLEELLAAGVNGAQLGHRRAEQGVEKLVEVSVLGQREAQAAVDDHRAAEPVRMPRRRRRDHPAAHRMAQERRALHTELVEGTDQVVGVRGHRVRTADLAGASAAAQVRRDEVDLRQRLGQRCERQAVGGDAVRGEYCGYPFRYFGSWPPGHRVRTGT